MTDHATKIELWASLDDQRSHELREAAAELRRLQAENESLWALASLGRKWIDLQNVTAQAIDLCGVMDNKAIVMGIRVTGKATPLAELPEKRE